MRRREGRWGRYDRTTRSARSSPARFARFGDRPLQLPLSLLHAARSIRRGAPFLAQERHPQLRGNHACCLGTVRNRRAQSALDGRRTAAAARFVRTCPPSGCSRYLGRSRHDNQWSAAGDVSAGLERRRAPSRHRESRRLGRSTVSPPIRHRSSGGTCSRRYPGRASRRTSREDQLCDPARVE